MKNLSRRARRIMQAARDSGLRVLLAAVIAVLPGFSWVRVSYAQFSVPSLMNFQGRLTDASNNPLAGAHAFIFEIYDASAGGNLLWTETQPAVTVVNGVLAAQLGSVNALSANVFAVAGAYLQITVDGVPLSPRERLITAPYAFSAQYIQGRDYTALVSTDAVNQSIAGVKTFTGTINVPAPTADSHAATKLYVDGAVGGNLVNSTNTWSAWQTYLNQVTISTDLYMSLGQINLRGNRVTTAAGKLDAGQLSGSLTASSGTFTQTGDYSVLTSSGISVPATAGVYAGFFVGNGAGLTGLTGVDSSKVAKAGDGMTGPLTMLAGSTITVTGSAFSVGGSGLVLSAGNVGIGTSSPGTALDVIGGAAVSGSLTASSGTFTQTGDYSVKMSSGISVPATAGVYAGFFVGNGAGLTGLSGTDSTKVAKAGDTMTGQLTIVSSQTVVGAAGIGAADLGNGTLVVRSTSTDAANPVLNLQANNAAELLRVQQDGRVGIGVSNPNSLLSVGANFQMDSTGRINIGGTPVATSLFYGSLNNSAINYLYNAGSNSLYAPNLGSGAYFYGATSVIPPAGGTSALAAGLAIEDMAVASVAGTITDLVGVSVAGFSPKGAAATVTNQYSGRFALPVNGANNRIGMLIGAAPAGPLTSSLYVASGEAHLMGSVGIGTTAPGTNLDVAGSAAVSGSLTVSSGTFTQTGDYSVKTSSGISVPATAGVYAGFFVGDGSGLSNLSGTDSSKVLKSGDGMSGPLTMLAGSTITVTGNAFSVGGSTFVIAGSSVGLRTPSPFYALHNAADTYTQGQLIVGGTMTVKGGAFSFNASDLVLTGNKVGIGTASPGTTLDVAGSAAVSGSLTVSSGTFTQTGDYSVKTSSGISVPGTAGVYAGFFVGDGAGLTGVNANPDASKVAKAGDTMSGQLTLSGSTLTVRSTGGVSPLLVSTSATQGHASLYVDGAGNVGVGTTAPAERLHVAGNIKMNATNNYIDWPDGYGRKLQLAGTSDYIDFNAPTTSWDFVRAAGGVDKFRFMNAASVLLQIQTNGFIGIGTTQPLAQLHLARAGSPDMMFWDTTWGGQLGKIVGVGDGGAWTDARLTLQSVVAGGAFIDTLSLKNGSVGIGTNVPLAVLHVTSQPSLGTNVLFQVGGGSLAVTGAGKVGIGTTSPGTALDVAGSAAVSGSLTVSSGTFTQTGDYSVKTSSGISVPGTAGVYAGFFVGDGAGLTGVNANPDSSKVAKAGDTMTGQLTLSGSTLTVRSTGGVSPLLVSTSATPGVAGLYVDGFNRVGIGMSAPVARLTVGNADVGTNLNLALGYASLGSPYGTWATVLGANVKAAEDTSGGMVNTNTHGSYGGSAIYMRADDGIVFHTKSGGVTANDPYSSPRLKIGADGRVGIGTTSPGTNLDIAGSAAVSGSLTVSSGTFTQTGDYSVKTSSGISVPATAGVYAGFFVGDGTGLTNLSGVDSSKVLKGGDAMTGPLSMLSGSTITISGNAFSVGGSSFTVLGGSATLAYQMSAASFVGSGAALTGIPSTASIVGVYVQKAGDGMSGPLTMLSGSTITVSGNAFSVGGSTFVIAGSSIGLRTSSPFYALHNAADTYTQGQLIVGGTMTVRGSAFSFNATDLVLSGNKVGIGTASPGTALHVAGSAAVSGSLTASSGTFTQTGDYSVKTSSGISVPGTAGVYAGFFVGDGTGLTNLSGVDGSKVMKTGDGMTGPLTMLSGSTITVSGNAFSVGGSSFTVLGGSATLAYQMSAASFVGSGAALTGIPSTASIVGVYVQKAGDGMSGPLTMLSGSTITVTGNAFSVGGSTFVIAGSSVGLRTSSPFYALHNAADTYTQGQLIVGGTMTVKGSAFSFNATDLVLTGNKVGIGTASPGTTLHVAGSAAVSGSLTASSGTFTQTGDYSVKTSSGISVPGTAGVYAGFFVGDGSGLSNLSGVDGSKVLKAGDTMTGQLTLSGSTLTVRSTGGVSPLLVSTSATQGHAALYVDGTGNVGVGTAAPGTMLDVNGSAAFGRPASVPSRMTLRADDGAPWLELFTLGFRRANFNPNEDAAAIVFGRGGSGTEGNIRFKTQDAASSLQEKMRISELGNVGIGSLEPAAKLHLSSGTLLIDGNVATSINALRNVIVGYGLTAASGTFTGGVTASSGTFTANAANTYSVLTSSGISVPGTAGVYAGFFVGSGAGLTGVNGTDASRVLKAGDTMTGQLTLSGSTMTVRSAGGVSPLLISTSATQGHANLYIDGSGNVGVGTLAPATPLHVSASGSSIMTLESNNPMIVMDDNNGNDVGLWNVNGDFRFLKNDLATTNMRVDQGGNVGIGTAGAPSTKLHMSSGTLTIDGNVATSINALGNVLVGYGLTAATGTFTGGLTASSGTFTSAAANVYSVTTSSGISVPGTAGVYAGFFVGSGAGLTGVNGTDASRVLKAGDTMTGQLTLSGSTMTVRSAGGVSPLLVSTSATQGSAALYIDGTGKVGIGTTSPAGSLHVMGGFGAMRVDSSLAGNQYGDMAFYSGATRTAGVRSHNATSSTPNMLEIWSEIGDVSFSVGNVGIGSAAPGSSKLFVQGGAAEAFHLRVSSQDASGNLLVVDRLGNVGVGTTAPGAHLHIRSGGNTALRIDSDTGGYSTLDFYNGQTTTSLWQIRRPPSSTDLRFFDGTGDRMTLQNGGNVGIGVGALSPATLLDVSGSAQFGAGVLKSTFTATPGVAAYALQLSSGVTLANGGPVSLTSGGYIRFADGSVQLTAPGSGTIGGSGTLNFIPKFTAGTTLGDSLLFDNGTNVGIGATSPASKLDVNGDFTARGQATVTSTMTVVGNAFSVGGSTLIVTSGNVGVGVTPAAATRFQVEGQTTLQHNSGGQAAVVVNQAGASWVATFRQGGSDKVTIINSGNMGLGTTAPQNPLDVEGAVAIGAAYSGTSVGPSNGLIVEGNVGIGTSSPLSKLDVNGDFTARGQATITSTATVKGNAFSVGGSTFAIAGSSIGIRTLSPFYALHNAADTYTQGQLIVGGTMTVKGSAFSVNTSDLVLTGNKVGIGTASPGTTLHVAGSAAVSGSLTASSGTFTATGTDYSVKTSSGISVPGTAGVYAGFFVGSGAGLTGVNGTDGSKVLKAGDTMTGQLTLSGSTLTVRSTGGVSPLLVSTSATQGNAALYVDGAGYIGLGTTSPSDRMEFDKINNNGLKFSGVNATITSTDNLIAIGQNIYLRPTASNGAYVDTGSGLFVTAGSLGVGTNSPAAKMHLSSGTLLVDGNGAMPFRVGVSTFVIDGTTGRVGIGSSAPSQRLQIGDGSVGMGNVVLEINGYNNNGTTGELRFFDPTLAPGAGYNYLKNTYGAGTELATYFNLDLKTNSVGAGAANSDFNFYSNTARWMTIKGVGGNVGISTGTPSMKLDVNGGLLVRSSATISYGIHAGSGTFTAGITASSGTFTQTGDYSVKTSSGISVPGTAGVYAGFFVGSGAGITGVNGTDSSKVAKAGDTMTGQLTLSGSTLTVRSVGAVSPFLISTSATQGNAALYVDGSGSVGIGVTAPTSRLDVFGGARFGGFTQGTSLRIEATDTGGAPATAAALQIHGYEDRGKGMVITDLSNTDKWWIGEGYDYTGIGIGYDTTAGDLEEYAANAKLFVNSAGLVGIGTVAPQATLHVSSAATSAATNILLVSTGSTASQQLLAIKGNGSIGIGTSSPDAGARLHFQSDSVLNEILVTRQGAGIAALGGGYGYPANTIGAMSSYSSSGGYYISGQASPNASLTALVLEGIQKASPAAGVPAIEFTGSQRSGGTNVALGDTDTILGVNNFYGANKFVVMGSGSVGISTPTPNATLEVNGSAMFGLNAFKSTFTATPGTAAYALQLSSGVTLANGGPVSLTSGGYIRFADGSTQTTAPGSGTIGGSGTINRLSKFTAGTTLGDSQLFDNGASIGIGTTNPASKLHMSSGTLTIDGDAAASFRIGTSTMIVNSTGLVGIGTSAPAASLDIRQSDTGGAFPTATLHLSSGGSDGAYLQSVSGSAFDDFSLVAAGYFNGTNWIAKSGTSAKVEATGGKISFYGDTGLTTGNTFTPTKRMTIDASGNVGIGTPSPAAKIHVSSGTLYVDGAAARIYVSSGNIITDYGVTASTVVHNPRAQPGTAANGMVYYDSGSNKLRLYNGGWVDIATGTTPSASNFVYRTGDTMTGQLTLGGSTLTVRSTGGVSPLLVSTSATQGHAALYIDGTGNVGLGTTSPAYKLDLSVPAGSGININSTAQNNIPLNILSNNGISSNGPLFDIRGQVPANPALKIVNNAANILWVGAYDGYVGIGTTSPASRLHVSSGTLFIDGDATSSLRIGASTMTVASSGNVGIGVSNPAFKLDVFAGSGDIQRFFVSGVRDYRLGVTPGGYFYVSDGSAGATRLTVDLSGNVGIGSTSPQAKLYVSSGNIITDYGVTASTVVHNPRAQPGTAANGMVYYDSGSNKLRLYNGGWVDIATGAVPSASNFVYRTGDTMTGQLTLNGSTLTVRSTGGVSPLLVSTSATLGNAALYIDGSGRVGVGTTAPNHALAVINPTLSVIQASLSATGGTGMTMQSDPTYSYLWGYDAKPMLFGVGGVERMRIDTAGNLGMNDTGPDGQLDIVSKSGEAGFIVSVSSQNDTTGNILSILGNGNVGIGSTAPGQLLTMSGQQHLALEIKSNTTGSTNQIATVYSNSDSAERFYTGLDDEGANAFHVGDANFTNKYLTVMNTGFVGIGSSAPTYKLDVNGPAVVRSSSMTWAGAITADPPATAAQGAIYYNTSTNKMRVLENGAWADLVGGASDPTRVSKAGDTMTGQLTVTGSSITIINATNGDPFSLAVTSASNRSVYHLVVSTMGNVGIGTSSPGRGLEVSGLYGAQLYATGPNNSATTSTNWLRSPKNTVTAFFGDNDNTSAYTDAEFSANLRFNGAGVNWGDFGYYPTGGDAYPEAGHFRLSLAGSNVDTAPDAKLGVGAIYATGNATASPSADIYNVTAWSGGWRNNLRVMSTDGPNIRFYATSISKTSVIGNNNDGGLWFGVNGTNDAFGSNAMVIAGSGNVGIGSTSPAAKLDVAGDAQFGAGILKSTFTATPSATVYALRLSSGVTLANGGPVSLTAGGFVRFGDGTMQTSAFTGAGTDATRVSKTGDTMTGQLTLSGSTLTVRSTGGVSPLLVSTSATLGNAALYINGTGQVGIGTTAPGWMLNSRREDTATTGVINPVAVLSNLQYTAGTGATLGFEFGAGTIGAGITGHSSQSNSGGYLTFSTRDNAGSYGERLRITGNGNVGIGAAAGATKLDVQQDISNTLAVNISSNNGTSMVVVDKQGNVGIGVANPAEKLDVAGDIRASGAAGYYMEMGAYNSANLGYQLIQVNDAGHTGYDTFFNNWSSGGLGGGWVFGNSNINSGVVKISSTGSVGIGTTTPPATPVAKLYVSSGNIITDYGVNASTVVHNPRAVPGTGTNGMVYYDSSSNKLRLYNGGWVDITTGSYNTAGGNFVSRTGDTMTGQLTLSGSTLTVRSTGGVSPLLVSTSATQGHATLYVNGTGNVGIGTTNPTHPLYVDGTSQGSNDSTLTLYSSQSNDVFSILPSAGVSYMGTGVHYLNGSWAHDGSGTSNALFALYANGGGAWYSSNNSAASWNVANNVSLWNATGNWAAQVQSTRAGDSYITGGNVGIGTSSPGKKLEILGGTAGIENIQASVRVNGSAPTSSGIKLINSASDDDSGAAVLISSRTDATFGGDADFVLKATYGGVLTERLRVQSDGDVGIGTTSPTSKLHIFKSSTYNSEGTSGIQLDDGTSDTGLVIGADAANDAAYVQSLDPGTSYTTRKLLLNPNGGNVGIGTSAPGTGLHLVGSAAISGSVTASSGTFTATGTDYSVKTSSGISVPGTAGVYAGFFVGNGAGITGITATDSSKVAKAGDTMTGQLTLSGSTLTVRSTGGVSPLLISTSATQGNAALYVSGTGSVGIGTTSPGNKVQIAGTGGSTVDLLVNGRIQTGDATAAGGVWLSNNTDMLVGQNGTNVGFWTGTANWGAFQVTQTGNVGIGTTNPLFKLDVGGVNSGYMIHVAGNSGTNPAMPTQGGYIGWNSLTGGAGEMDFFANNGGGTGGFAFFNADSAGVIVSTPMVIAGSGNVGLNNLAPATTLDVTANNANTAAIFRNSAGVAIATVNVSGIIASTQQWGFTIHDAAGLVAADNINAIIANRLSGLRIVEVWCVSDDATAAIQLQRDDGSPANILSSNLTCGTAGTATTTFSGSEFRIAAGDKINYLQQAVGAATRINVVIKYAID